jgi:hypothetical protein
MRLLVPVFLLVISLTPFSLAQHSGGSGGVGGSAGGGGGASYGGSGGGSHGGSSSGGSWSGGNSGGHSSGGSASHTSAGGHGSNGGTSSSRSGTSDLNKHSGNDTSRFESFGSYASDIPRESAAVREHLIEHTLDRMQFELPSNLKTDRPISSGPPKHKGPGADNLLVGKKEKTSKEPEPARKPVKFKRFCGPGSAGRRCAVSGYHWNLTPGVYDSIQENCGNLDQRLTREEDKTSPLRSRQTMACVATPLSPECSSASREVAKADLKIGRLREKYQHCVVRDLQQHARVIISRR